MTPHSPATRSLADHRPGAWMALVAVAGVALLLRPAATSVGPLLRELQQDLGGGELGAGALTALPPLVFGVLGFGAVPVARRAGLSGAVVLALAVSVLGLAVRPWVTDMALFLVLSVVALVGGALGNVLVPAWIKRHSSGTQMRRLTAVYAAVLGAGGSLGALLAVPLAGLPRLAHRWDGATDPSGGAWRTSVMVWALVTLVPLLTWVVVARRTGYDFPRSQSPSDAGADPVVRGRGDGRRSPVAEAPIWSSPTAVALTAMFAVQSTNAYTQFGWLPRVYAEAGVGPGLAGVYTAVIAACGVVGGLVMPTLIDRAPSLPVVAAGCGALTALGYLGLLVAPASLALLWALVLGVGGFAFPMVIALLPARTRDPGVTARLSGVVQPVGYVGAALGPLLVGGLVALTGHTRDMLWVMAASGLLLGALGWRAARETVVDDELVGATS